MTEVRSFLGLCSYYRRFIHSFSQISKPLHVLTEKNRFFEWTDPAEKAFQTLKEKLTTAPILVYPSETDQFILDTDASNHHIGAVISQVQQGQERVIAYYSRTLNKSERNYCITRKELLAIVAAVKHFRPYLYGKQFKVQTDHGALTWLMKFKHPEAQVAHWIEVLDTYDFKIEHRPGKSHGNADALSRRPCDGIDCKQCNKMERSGQETQIHIPSRKPTNRNQQTEVVRVIRENNWILNKTKSEIRQVQLCDKVLSKVIRLKETRTLKPSWHEISTESPTFKMYWSIWDNLYLHEGVLYCSYIQKIP